MTTPLRILRGIFSQMASKVGTLLYGAPCQAHVDLPDGSTFEMLFSGGFDNANHLLGGGDQTCQGEPTWNVPDPYSNSGAYKAGLRTYDTLNRYIWISNADGTWTAFCPCIGGTAPAPGSSGSSGSSGSGGGGGGGISSPGCAGVILPTILYAKIQFPSNYPACLSGTFALTYNPDLGNEPGWASPVFACAGQNVQYCFGYAQGIWWFALGVGALTGMLTDGQCLWRSDNQNDSFSLVCSPFSVQWSGENGDGNMKIFGIDTQAVLTSLTVTQ